MITISPPTKKPPSDPPSQTLHLTHPSPSQIAAQTKLHALSWRGALSVEAYLRREKFLHDQDWTRDGGVTYWALVNGGTKQEAGGPVTGIANGQGDKESEPAVLCGCETFRKRGLVAESIPINELTGNGDSGNSSYALNGASRPERQTATKVRVREVLVHGLGTVFCDPQFRGRGFAGKMMALLNRELRTWQAEDEDGGRAGFSVLYSDIGKVSFRFRSLGSRWPDFWLDWEL